MEPCFGPCSCSHVGRTGILAQPRTWRPVGPSGIIYKEHEGHKDRSTTDHTDWADKRTHLSVAISEALLPPTTEQAEDAPSSKGPVLVPLVIESERDALSGQPVTAGLPFPR